MRPHWTLARIIMSAAVIAGGMSPAAEAGQRTGRLSVSVQVVDSCSSITTGAQAGFACAGSTTPVAIVREPASGGAAAPPQSAGPVSQVENELGLVTIIY